MNDDDLRTIKDAVCALYAARLGVKPSMEVIVKFDKLYHSQKVGKNV
jgi:hypothetical protein